jgi:hypothetical protein
VICNIVSDLYESVNSVIDLMISTFCGMFVREICTNSLVRIYATN